MPVLCTGLILRRRRLGVSGALPGSVSPGALPEECAPRDRVAGSVARRRYSMKARGLVVVLLGLALAGTAMAQETQEKAIDFGFKGGINLAELSYDPDPFEDGTGIDKSMYLRFGGGVVLSFNITPTFSIDANALYLMKGSKHTGDGLVYEEYPEYVFDVDARVNLSYIVVNPMIRFSPVAGGVAPYFMVGPEIGFLMDAKMLTEVSGGGETIDGEEDIKDDLKSTDMALNFGAGFEFPSGSSTFFLEAQYSLGLTNISDPEEEEGEDSELEIKTKGIYFFAGIRF
jgi:hypothetical protein